MLLLLRLHSRRQQQVGFLPARLDFPEILGPREQLPWPQQPAVFLHPAGGFLAESRFPVQLAQVLRLLLQPGWVRYPAQECCFQKQLPQQLHWQSWDQLVLPQQG